MQTNWKVITLAVVTFLMPAVQAMAQHETDKWYFGRIGEGLDFTGRCAPEVLNDGEFIGFEGCSTVSDRSTGALLFYTNSETVIGADHLPMPNGDLEVVGNERTITQVLITAHPGNNDQYLIFTNQIQGWEFGGQGMRMACVDMTLNGGYGDVIFKDSIIYSATVSEKVTGVRHANGSDLWVIGHGYPGDEFFAVRITPQGATYPAVISNVGKYYGKFSDDCIGEMKADPNGDKIAVVTIAQPNIELFEFDRASGVVSGPVVISSPELAIAGNSWLYGVSFSPDGSKLYAGRKNFGGGAPSLIQVDVASSDSLQIASSYTVLSTLDSIYSVQLAPNGRMYTRRAGVYLGAINYPDSAGLACDFDPYAVVFPQEAGVLSAWGFNNYIALTDYPCIDLTGIADVPNDIQVTIYPVPSDGEFTVRLDRYPRSAYLVIRDLLGREVDRIPIKSTTTNVRLDQRGYWTVEVWDAHAPVAVRRVVVN